MFLRQLSRHLVGLWTAENPVAINLLKRILVSRFQTLRKKKIDAVPILMPEAFSVMIVIAHTFCWQLRELVQSLHSFHFGFFISVLVANRPVGIPGQS